MGDILNPNNELFRRKVQIKAPGFYVDKTDFIAHMNNLICSDSQFICFTRPRRFGKTITAQMLSAYYSKGCESAQLFDGLKIESDPSYSEHINKYNVIYIDMNFIQQKYESLVSNPIRSINTDFIHDVVDYLNFISTHEILENKEYAKIVEQAKDTVNPFNLADVVNAINNKTSESFVFIMDEWDFVYREYKNDTQLQQKFINLLKGLFKSDCQKAFALVYLTGILPIKKYNSESALNNFREYNMLRPKPYARFFGFTEDEVEKVSSERNSIPTFENLKQWYDGYNLNGTSILNPNSVSCAIYDGECQSYWTNTAAFTPLLSLIDMNLDGFKEDLLKILAGDKVAFDASTFQNDMVNVNNKDDAFCLLVCLGYLACTKKTESTEEFLAYVPNLEISSVLKKFVMKQNWFPQMELVQRSEELYKATIAKNGNRVAEIIDEIHNGPHVSALTYNSESALSYCVLFGYSWILFKTYNTFRELESGKGFVDIAYVPLDSLNPVLIIELKYGVSTGAALTQIRSKNYAKDLASRYPNVLLVAINYDTKTKKHECAIEEY